jgi:hypothetical protein
MMEHERMSWSVKWNANLFYPSPWKRERAIRLLEYETFWWLVAPRFSVQRQPSRCGPSFFFPLHHFLTSRLSMTNGQDQHRTLNGYKVRENERKIKLLQLSLSLLCNIE